MIAWSESVVVVSESRKQRRLAVATLRRSAPAGWASRGSPGSVRSIGFNAGLQPLDLLKASVVPALFRCPLVCCRLFVAFGLFVGLSLGAASVSASPDFVASDLNRADLAASDIGGDFARGAGAGRSGRARINGSLSLRIGSYHATWAEIL